MTKKTRYSLLKAWVPNYRESQRTGNNWVTNPRGQDDSYKKEKKKLRKEGDGGGATSGSFGDGGGTVFTSTNAGIFTPTHSERGERKKNDKKKRTGVDKLADFVNDDSPERKMQKATSGFVLNLIDLVELRKKVFRQATSSTAINDQTKQTDGLRNPVEFDASPDDQSDVEQKDMERKIKMLDDKEDSHGGKTQDTGSASQAAPAGLDIQLRWESGTPQDDLATGGDRDKDQGKIEELEEETKETPFHKLLGKDLYQRLVGED